MNWQQEYDALYDAIDIVRKAWWGADDLGRDKLSRISVYLRTEAQSLRPWSDRVDRSRSYPFTRPESGVSADTVSRF
jgi:hypothetical protein